MAKRVYFRQPESAESLTERINNLFADSVISEDLAIALDIAVAHSSQLDYDGLQEEYNETDSEDLRQLMVDLGVIIVLTEEQTRSVKYGV